jgi:hypothetical protein
VAGFRMGLGLTELLDGWNMGGGKGKKKQL